ncbi:MAG: PP2C family protein-serine/threonine phosphatase [Acidimicrobiia bacterium]
MPKVPLHALDRLTETAGRIAPSDIHLLVDLVCELLGAQAGRLHVADYSLRRLQRIGADGAIGSPEPIAGTLVGRAFTTDEPTVSVGEPTTVAVPLVHGTTRIGLLELDFDTWDGSVPAMLNSVLTVFVLILTAKGRYTDYWHRAQRSEPLSPAAEIQWDLLPPLSCTTDRVAVGGILEPAYDIGGDSFDYAINGSLLQFAIVDAAGRGASAVLQSAAAINSLRNARRAGLDLVSAYRQADRLIEVQFGLNTFVTGLIGTLDLESGVLTWINAGHVLPMLVRNRTYAGELACAPSTPFGLGQAVAEVATEALQPGDRVLFYTDGLIEAKSPDGNLFGSDRLADFLVRASMEDVAVAETARRLSENCIEFADATLKDDATLLLVEYFGPPPTA